MGGFVEKMEQRFESYLRDEKSFPERKAASFVGRVRAFAAFCRGLGDPSLDRETRLKSFLSSLEGKMDAWRIDRTEEAVRAFWAWHDSRAAPSAGGSSISDTWKNSFADMRKELRCRQPKRTRIA